MSTVFITGCATGFGRRVAEILLADGHHVVVTDPDRSALAAFESEARALVRALDVRDAVQVHAVVAEAIAWSPPDVLVNNGGFAVFGTQEETDLELVRDLFDVNVLGVGRVTQALLPTLRERSGTIVQLSSVAGRTVFPESGWYAATKYAVEAMSEALFQECATFGVKVRLIEPGSFDTQFLPTAIAVSGEPPEGSAYDPLRDVWMDRKVEALEPPQDPDAVARAIVGSLDDARPFVRIPVGPDSIRMLALRDALGADPWMMLQARRNAFTGEADDLFTPERVLAASDDDLGPVRAARDAGQLEHWKHLPKGIEALARLATKDESSR